MKIAAAAAVAATLVLAAMLLLAIVSIFTVSPAMLSVAKIHYVTTGGNVIEKFHPASYFAFMAFGLLLLRNGDPIGEINRMVSGAKLVLGGAVIALAHVLLVLLIASFVRAGVGTQNPLDPPRELVQRGAYRWGRNPMYLLLVVIALGLAILYRSPPLLAYAGAFALCLHCCVLGVE